jgi:hypothetical protein
MTAVTAAHRAAAAALQRGALSPELARNRHGRPGRRGPDGRSRRYGLHRGRRPKASNEGTRARLGRTAAARYGDLMAVVGVCGSRRGSRMRLLCPQVWLIGFDWVALTMGFADACGAECNTGQVLGRAAAYLAAGSISTASSAAGVASRVGMSSRPVPRASPLTMLPGPAPRCEQTSSHPHPVHPAILKLIGKWLKAGAMVDGALI